MKKNLIITTLALSLVLLGGCGDTNSNTHSNSNNTSNSTSNSNSNSNSTTNGNGNINSNTTTNKSADIGKEAAKEIAFSNANVKEADVSRLTINLETENGVQVYDVEFDTADKEYNYEITATDGTIYSSDVDVKNSTNLQTAGDTNKTTADSTTPAVSEADAKKAALEKVSGATEDNLKIEYKYDDGRYVYDGEIRYNQKEYDFEIDANTGKFLEWSEEHIQS